MTHSRIEQVARAVLFEGYMLYPYRPSVKSTLRWTFGVVHPDGLAPPGERSTVLVETPVRLLEHTRLDVSMRFLHVVEWRGGSPWQEGRERRVEIPGLGRDDLCAGYQHEFTIPARRWSESHPPVVKEQQELRGHAHISLRPSQAQPCSTDILSVRVANTTPPPHGAQSREDSLPHAFVSLQVVLTAKDGQFLSVIDPPGDARDAAAECRSEGLWPVLVGDEGTHAAVLAAPIILADYPHVAPQSPGDLFDCTEIDEILTLRVQTLSDAEKEIVARLDPQTAALLARSEAIEPARMAELHGTLRRCPSSNAENGPRFVAGDRVRLQPNRRADIFDMALAERAATIVAVEHDGEGVVYYAVTIDDDPGADLGEMSKIAHRFFFREGEVRPLERAGVTP